MINKQANILFIPTSIRGYSAEPEDTPSQNSYYQRLIYASLVHSIHTTEGFQILGQHLATIARQAYFAKQMNAVEQATQLMLALPLSNQLQAITRYYQALCIWRQGERDAARRSLECIAEEATPQYRARALQIIGLTYHEVGDADTALPFYLAAGKSASNCDPATVAMSLQMTAVVRSIHGDHKQALADLEKLFPIFREVGKYYPTTYYEYLNSLAVELAEVGRIAEAETVCAITLASPFAAVYSNWAETRDEIAAKRTAATPSVIAVNRAAECSPQIERRVRTRLLKLRVSNWPVPENLFLQRASVASAATGIIAQNGVTQTILNRVLICTGSRAPPAFF